MQQETKPTIQRAWDFTWRAALIGAIGWLVGKALDAAQSGVTGRLSGVTAAFSPSTWPLWGVMVGVFIGLFWAAWPSIRPRRTLFVRGPDTTTPLPSGREYVSITPQDLRNLFKGRTAAQGTILAEQYIGKWMIVSGRFGDALPPEPGMTRFQVTFATGLSAFFSYYVVFLWFDARWRELVGALRSRERITVHGKIDRVTQIDVNLSECEIWESGHPVVPVPQGSPIPQQPPVATVHHPESGTVSQRRELVSVTPQELRRSFAGVTTAEGKARVKWYIGKAMEVSGALGDRHALRPGSQRFMVTFASGTFRIDNDPEFGQVNYLVYLWFESHWQDRLAAIPVGSIIAVQGTIEEIEPLAMNLDDCEIVSTGGEQRQTSNGGDASTRPAPTAEPSTSIAGRTLQNVQKWADASVAAMDRRPLLSGEVTNFKSLDWKNDLTDYEFEAHQQEMRSSNDPRFWYLASLEVVVTLGETSRAKDWVCSGMADDGTPVSLTPVAKSWSWPKSWAPVVECWTLDQVRSIYLRRGVVYNVFLIVATHVPEPVLDMKSFEARFKDDKGTEIVCRMRAG
jgi:hypothetical protein